MEIRGVFKYFLGGKSTNEISRGALWTTHDLGLLTIWDSYLMSDESAMISNEDFDAKKYILNVCTEKYMCKCLISKLAIWRTNVEIPYIFRNFVFEIFQFERFFFIPPDQACRIYEFSNSNTSLHIDIYDGFDNYSSTSTRQI